MNRGARQVAAAPQKLVDTKVLENFKFANDTRDFLAKPVGEDLSENPQIFGKT